MGGHGGMPSLSILCAIRGPAFAGGLFQTGDTCRVDIVPTLYEVMGWTPPANVDGRVLHEVILDP